jgi:hypothetical protein
VEVNRLTMRASTNLLSIMLRATPDELEQLEPVPCPRPFLQVLGASERDDEHPARLADLVWRLTDPTT